MTRRITKLMAALALLVFMMPGLAAWGQTTVTFTAGTDTGATSVTKDGITVSMSTMSRTDNYRCYANTAMTVASTIGNITSVELTCTGSGTSSYGPGLFSITQNYTGSYSYSGYVGTWTGSSENISLTASAQVRMTEIVVTVGGSAPTSFTITYDANGGTGTMTDENSPYDAGATVTVLENTFTRDNYTFDHWNTSADDNGTNYDEGDQFIINANTTLYAQWTENGGGTSGTTATLNIQSYATAHNWVSGTQYLTATVDPVTFTAAGGGNTGKYYSNGQDWRYYQGESATITISVPEGYTLVSVTPTYGIQNGGALKNGNSTIASGSTVSVSGTSVTFTVGNSGTATNGQVRFTNIDVAFVADGGTQTTSDLTITNTSTDLTFDLYNNSDAQVITYTTSSTGAITITPAESDYFTYIHDAQNKTITVTPTAVTPSAQTVTIHQEADNDYYAGTATFTVSVANSDPNIPGTENNPYTVAQARAAIDAGTGTQGVYATGIVSAIPTAWNTQYSNITFNMVDESGDTDFLQAYRCVSGDGVDASTVAIGDIVVVYGNLTKYNSTYEFAQGCQLVSLEHPAVTVEAPTFNPVAGTYADAQNVSISCETPNVSIYYTTDGSDPDDESTLYDGPITVSTATTIKAVAYDTQDNNSTVAIANYYFCSAEAPYTVTEAMAFEDYQYPTHGIYVHGIVSTAAENLNNGTLTYYISVDGEATNELEVYKGKGLNNEAFTAVDDIQVGDIVTIYGNVQVYNNIIEFASGNYLVYFERPAIVEPSITVTPAEVNAPFAGADGALAITYENIPELISFDIQFCDANGEELEGDDPEWIYAEITEPTETEGYTVSYIIEENDGEARSAYFKVYTFVENGDDLEEVYSNLVTINQAQYVVDYAELPFEFDGGKADIETTNGLTQNGLGGDYGSSPKLKFDGANDWVILHFIEEPGVLTFDIKGNGSGSDPWAGIFKVQVSNDGVTYTDLATYTELGATQHETFYNLTSDVRYIKWVYIEKTVGNVALGNIALTEYVAPQQYTLTVEPFENLELITFVNDEMVMEEAGEIQVYNGDHIMLSIVADEGYVMETLMVNGVDHVNDIAADFTYEFDMPAEAVTISATAVEYVVPTPGNWVLTDLADLTADDIFVIVCDNGDTYAMPYDGGGQGGAPAAVEVTVVEGTLSEEPAANIQWNLSITEDGYIFYPNGDTENWLYCTNTNNGVRVGTNENNVFRMDDESGYLVHNGTGRYIGIYNSQDWRCYTNTTGNIANQSFTFYKKVVEPQTFTRVIAGYGTSTNGGYYLISTPVDDIDPADIEGMIDETETNYDLFYFDQTQTLEWQTYKQGEGFNLVSGMGYLYANKNGVTLEITGVPNTNGEVSLVYDDEAAFKGWNLVGNPLGDIAYINKPFYEMNPQTGAEIIPAESRGIEIMEGIFVVATEDGELLNFSTTMPGKQAAITMNVSRNRGTVIDRAIVNFGEGGMLPKFQINQNNTKIYIPEGETNYAVVRSANEGEMPVNFKAAENGTYTISISTEEIEMEYMHLIDRVNGNDIDLLATPSYSFEARTTDNANRFSLVFRANAINENEGNSTFAFFNGSEWIINSNGEATLQVVDTLGHVISSETIKGNATVSTSNLSAGVYIMRLMNGENVMTQKVVVK